MKLKLFRHLDNLTQIFLKNLLVLHLLQALRYHPQSVFFEGKETLRSQLSWERKILQKRTQWYPTCVFDA